MSDLTDRLDAIQKRKDASNYCPTDNACKSEWCEADRDRAFLLDLARKAAQLIADLTDPEDCSFDHHGGCQAHGYLSLQPGETCPQHDAKEWAKP